MTVPYEDGPDSALEDAEFIVPRPRYPVGTSYDKILDDLWLQIDALRGARKRHLELLWILWLIQLVTAVTAIVALVLAS